MTDTLADTPVLADLRDDCLTITLNRPRRGNALTPDLLRGITTALDEHRKAKTIVLTGTGSAFSCGGDIREFFDRSGDRSDLLAFARDIVGTLNETLLRLVEQERFLVCALNGPVTGGSVGLMLACDHVIACHDAFAQPYYARMGFAPDGGWTAMMPDRAGAGFTRNWLALDRRLNAAEMLEKGIIDELCFADRMPEYLEALLARTARHDRRTLAAARLLGVGGRDALSRRLEDELQAFLTLIDRDETVQRMHDFLNPNPSPSQDT